MALTDILFTVNSNNVNRGNIGTLSDITMKRKTERLFIKIPELNEVKKNVSFGKQVSLTGTYSIQKVNGFII